MTDPPAIDKLLAHARSTLDRVQVQHLADEVAHGAILIDIRPVEQRQRDGDLPGAIVVDRNVQRGQTVAASLSAPQLGPAGRTPYVLFTLQCFLPEKVRN